MEASFPPAQCQICLPYVLCRLSPHKMTPSVSMKYFVTFAVVVLHVIMCLIADKNMRRICVVSTLFRTRLVEWQCNIPYFLTEFASPNYATQYPIFLQLWCCAPKTSYYGNRQVQFFNHVDSTFLAI